MTVLLAAIRHGETDWNLRGLIQGNADIPLNETGLAQARSVAEVLSTQHSHIDWFGVVTSPLLRAQETGRVIADALDIPTLEPMPKFAERDYGTMDGVAISRAKELHPSGEYPESEHNDQVLERARLAIEGLRNSYADRPLIVVSHGGLLHTLMSDLYGARLPSIQNATVNLLEYGEHGWKVRLVNNAEVAVSPSQQS